MILSVVFTSSSCRIITKAFQQLPIFQRRSRSHYNHHHHHHHHRHRIISSIIIAPSSNQGNRNQLFSILTTTGTCTNDNNAVRRIHPSPSLTATRNNYYRLNHRRNRDLVSTALRSESSSSSLSSSTTSVTSSSDDNHKYMYEIADLQRKFKIAVELYEDNKIATLAHHLPSTASSSSSTTQSDTNTNANANNGMQYLDIVIDEYEIESSQPEFWETGNKERNTYVNSQLSKYMRLRNRLQDWQRFKDDSEVALEMLGIGNDNESSSSLLTEDDKTGQGDNNEHDDNAASSTLSLFTDEEYASLVEELRIAVTTLYDDCERYQLELLLSGPYDECPCRIVLTAGAGGTEANDWVADLKRMYERHANKMGYQIRIEDEQPGDVVGYKSVEMIITTISGSSTSSSGDAGGTMMAGQHPYGWFKGEKGTHRLVRLSPFNANSKRQTTFAGVDVAPIVLDEIVLKDIMIPEKDLEITTMRSGGAGGQNVNKVNSAVRIKHLPSGLQVKCTQERSQNMNKELAMKRLKGQLLVIAQEQRVAAIQEIRGDQVEASWGTQIRNYVLHPYKMIKDQRNNWETTNVPNFLDGGTLLEECIATLLKSNAASTAATAASSSATSATTGTTTHE